MISTWRGWPRQLELVPAATTSEAGVMEHLATSGQRSWPRTLLAVLVPLSIAICASVAGACTSDDADSGVSVAEDGSVKVTVAGDSIALGLAIEIRETFVDPNGTVPGLDVKAIAVNGTGLARPDNFDWPARLTDLAAEFPPEVLVFSVGSNDAQDLTDVDGEVVMTMSDESGWDGEYRARLAASFDAFAGTDTRVVWLGQVRPERQLVADTNRRIHELATEVAATRDWVTVMDLADLTGSGADSISQCLISDGLHLTRGCYEQASTELLERLEIT